MTVCMTIDFDADSVFRDRKSNGPTQISRGLYGPNAGLKRLVNLLKQHKIPVTVFIPGEIVDRFPDLCKLLRDEGYEIGHHGYNHKAPETCSFELERIDFEKGLDSYQKILGVRPKGYRAPWLGHTQNTYRLLNEYGFEYDSSECGQDSPYFLNVEGKRLLEIPGKIELVDTPYFLNLSSQALLPSAVDPDTVEKIWKREFSGMYKANQNLCFVHTVHPFCIGHFYRLQVYANLLSHMKEHADVHFSTLGDLSKKYISEA